jgi:hypothetical protein
MAMDGIDLNFKPYDAVHAGLARNTPDDAPITPHASGADVDTNAGHFSDHAGFGAMPSPFPGEAQGDKAADRHSDAQERHARPPFTLSIWF